MEANLNFGLALIEQVALPVKDLDRAVAFYQSKLGMKHLFSSNGLAFFDCAGVRLMLSRPENAESDHPGSVIYFKVADIHLAHKALAGRGVVFEDSPHRIADMGTYELWMAFFRDSENNLLAISGEVKKD
jgi:catechol 2,3-dioxygenase-like lactoylglutathione lyase family enzyme